MRLVFFSLAFVLGLVSCSSTTKTVKQASISKLIKNIKIDEAEFGRYACEPSICIHPENTDIIVAGSVLNQVYTSLDGGQTWTMSNMESSSGVYGDPVIRADFKGNFYYAHLSNPNNKAWGDEAFLDRIVVQKSEDNGKTWNDGSFTPPNSPKDQDKEWLAVDPSDNTILMTWTEFDKYKSKEPEDRSRIMFTKSTDEGETWSEPFGISQVEGDCLDGDQTTEGAVPAAGINGEYFVSWSMDEKIYFDRSLDKGISWLSKDKIISNQPGGWDFEIPGISRCNGMPITEVDHSNGPHRGTIYVNWSDQRNGTDDTDIWISKSQDNGDSWTDPIRVNDDLAGKHQFFCWMDVDPSTGYIYIVFYDRRAYDDTQTDVYLAYSTDGAQSFTNIKISESPFVPAKQIFFGDYCDISAVNGVIRPIWTRADKWKLSVWTALIELK